MPICQFCHGEFIQKPQTKGLFCSRRCHYDSEAAKKPTVVCDCCGRPFKLSEAHARKGQKSCSVTCNRIMRKRRAVRIPIEERFWAMVDKGDGEGCWLWTGGTDIRGYGKMFTERGKPVVSAHRFSYELAKGLIPDGLFVLHRCDRPACVRPDHLFLGNQADNIHDMIAKGRQGNGLPSPPVFVTARQRSIILCRRRDGMTTSRIATELGIPYNAVRDVVRDPEVDETT